MIPSWANGIVTVNVLNVFCWGTARNMRIAVIGAGISGLTVAYRLAGSPVSWLPSADVTVFEANDWVGGHTHTVDVVLPARRGAAVERQAIDTGFIVFNERTYPEFITLLDELGVPSRPTEMSFSVRDERSGLEYSGSTLGGLFAQRRNLLRPRFYRMLADIVRFNREVRRWRQAGDDDVRVGEFLERERYSSEFAEHYLLPMGAAIWSCPLGRFAEFPIRFIAEFYENHGLLELRDRPIWRTITGGSRVYVERILARLGRPVRTRTPIASVRRDAEGVEISPVTGDPERFDHVVFACHSDQALRILGPAATPTERELLSSFPYERNRAVLHTDTSYLPERRRAWASWNYRIAAESSGGTAPLASRPANVTYNMNILQGLRSRETFCVTLNPHRPIAPQRIFGEYEYHHPVFTHTRAASQARHGELLSANRTSFCGAYWGNGFHEDGVRSGLAAVQAIRTLARGSDGHSSKPGRSSAPEPMPRRSAVPPGSAVQ